MTRRTRRRLVTGALVLLLVAVATAWIVKPWVPDIDLADPGPKGTRVHEAGVFANYYPADEPRSAAVLLLGGSEGGITDRVAELAVDLQRRGFSVLQPSYFGAPGQPGHLERVPLETFDRALAWLRRQPSVDPDRIAVVGHSKGAEAALLVGTRHPELRAVVAGAPSSVVWQGIDWDMPINPGPSWTANGKPLASLGYSLWRPWRTVGQGYENGLTHLSEHPEAEIRIERTRAPVLLVCGEADNLWPACPMARHLRARANERGGPVVTVLAYEGAGHTAFGPPLKLADPHLTERFTGGTRRGNYLARRGGWPRVISFLEQHLA